MKLCFLYCALCIIEIKLVQIKKKERKKKGGKKKKLQYVIVYVVFYTVNDSAMQSHLGNVFICCTSE